MLESQLKRLESLFWPFTYSLFINSNLKFIPIKYLVQQFRKKLFAYHTFIGDIHSRDDFFPEITVIIKYIYTYTHTHTHTGWPRSLFTHLKKLYVVHASRRKSSDNISTRINIITRKLDECINCDCDGCMQFEQTFTIDPEVTFCIQFLQNTYVHSSFNRFSRFHFDV